jgi:LmbE family N-acetylglucosaminyl deacetylase
MTPEADPPTPRSLLAVFAHPDDESLACGGTLARVADLGWNVTLVCASRG